MSSHNLTAYVPEFDVDNQELRPIIPVPHDAGEMNLTLYDKVPDKLYPYPNSEGELICYVGRWNKGNGQGKDIRPITFCETSSGERKWGFKSVPEPRPLYNLDKLSQSPECLVMICEGEKPADAAEILFPDFIMTTVMGGANAVHCADLTPLKGRHVKIAMDYDKSGEDYAKKLVKRLQSIGVNSLQILSPAIFKEYAAKEGKLVSREGDLSQGYDLADAVEEGWTAALILEYANDYGELFVDPQIIFGKNIQLPEETRQPSKIEGPALNKSAQASDKLSGSEIRFPDVEPWPEPVDVKVLLQDLINIWRRYAVLPDHAALSISLWIIFTWCIDHFDIAPILAICSPEKRCGKTTVLHVLQRLVNKPQPTANVTPAALFRLMEQYHPTLLIDEADTFLKNNEELRGILNAGHNRNSSFIIRTVGDQHIPRQFDTWGAKAIALIGHLPGTLEDRSIVVSLKRKRTHEKVERLSRQSLDFIDIKRKLKRLSIDFVATSKNFSFPEGLSDRAADNWEPLLTIAQLGGAEWYNKAFQAMITLSAHTFDGDSIGVQLLHDISIIFKEDSEDRIASQKLLDKLLKDQEKPWVGYNKGKGLSLQAMSKLLQPYEINSKSIRIGNLTCKGYERSQFQDAFQRYLSPISSDESVTPSQVASIKENLVTDSENRTPFKIQNGTEKPLIHKGCDDVTDQMGGVCDEDTYEEV